MDRIERRKSLRTLIVLSLPIILEEMLSVLLQYVDTAMVGRLGEEATASVNLTATVNWLIGSCLSAIGVAAVAMISTAYGAKDEKKIQKVSSQILLYSIIGGLLITVVAVGLSPFIPIWMQADVRIQAQAGEYFRIISMPLLFRAFWIILANSLRAIKDTKTPMVISIAANVLNVILNYLFIYVFGLGVRGAAIASAISFTSAGVAMLVVTLRNGILHCTLRGFHFDRNIHREAVRIGFPAFATSFASCMGHVVFASLVSSMGTTIFAAHSIALSAEEMFYVPGYGLRGATSTLIGISVGENDKDKFRVVEWQSVIMTVLMMAFTGLALFFLARPLMMFFTPSEPVIALGTRVLKLIAVSEPIFGLMIVCEGIYFGLGRTRNTFVVSAVGSWGIRILSTVILLRFTHATLFQIWICMFADNTFRALALALPLFAGKDISYFEDRKASV